MRRLRSGEPSSHPSLAGRLLASSTALCAVASALRSAAFLACAPPAGPPLAGQQDGHAWSPRDRDLPSARACRGRRSRGCPASPDASRHLPTRELAHADPETDGKTGRWSRLCPLATAGLSISMLILNSYVKDIDPGQDAQIHRDAASDIWNVREFYLSLLTDKQT